MNDFLKLLAESVDNAVFEIIGTASFIVVLFVAYYWVNGRLSTVINSGYLRRTIIAVLGLLIFSICHYILSRRERFFIEDLSIIVISVLTCYNIYYLFENIFNKSNKWWMTVANFAFLFFLIWICISSPTLFQVFIKKNYTYGWVIGQGHNLDRDVFMHSIKKNLIIFAEVALITTLINAAYVTIMKLQELRKKEKELKALKLKEQLTKAQLDALHAKINPHFLYNSLNSIAGLALTDGDKTRQMAISLSKFFRYSINHQEDNLVALGEELEMVRTYLDIEKIRFEERLNYEVKIDPGLEEIKIPRFILQPLVENSVKHGLKGTEHVLCITIHAKLEGKKLSLVVQDDGLPFAEDFEPGYGLKSIYDKLDILFPDKYEVALFNSPLKQAMILIEI